MWRIAHRGASAHAPENTLTAFKLAAEMGADAVELDIHLSSDGVPVVVHDETVDRTTGGKGRVARMTRETLQSLPIEGGEHIPTLGEVLDAGGRDMIYFLEIKQAEAAVNVAEAVRLRIEAGWQADRFWIISFQPKALRAARTALPDAQLGASVERWTKQTLREAEALGAQAILPHQTQVTQDRVKYAHGAGLKIVPWTVNQPDAIDRFARWGVDGIIGNHVDRLRQGPKR